MTQRGFSLRLTLAVSIAVVACGEPSSPTTPATDAAVSSDASSIDDAALLDAGVTEASTDAATDGGSTGWSLPPKVCAEPVALVDTSKSAAVVGTGTPASCTETQLRNALALGGIITFDCGPTPVTIPIAATMDVTLVKDTVIDGGGTVTLDGQNQARILSFTRPYYRTSSVTLTLQRIRLVNGKAPGANFLAANGSNPNCAYGYRDGGGGALLVRDNKLVVIDSVFENNHAATPGPDVGGGAIYALGSLAVTIVHSAFVANDGANGGAIGLLQSDATFVNSSFSGNKSLGVGGNYSGGNAQGCPGVGHANQGGAGGSGGAIMIDGSDDADQTFCGVVLAKNQANELGGAVFRTANYQARRTAFDRCSIVENGAKRSGALYVKNSKPLEIVASTFASNSAESAGMGQLDECSLSVTNTTIYGNRATKGLGGAIANFSGTIGTFRNVTFANNKAEAGSGVFSAAIAGQMNFQIYNTIFWNNTTLDPYNPMACGLVPATTGANDLQWPLKRLGGVNNDTPCVTGITFADANLGPLGNGGGPTQTAAPQTGSPAFGAGSSCPPTDQRGVARATACTIGAVE